MTISKPLLAHTVPTNENPKALHDLKYPIMWSVKLDGIRTLILKEKGHPVTRKFLGIPNNKVREFLSDPLLYGFDGECVFGQETGDGVLGRTQSAVMTIAGPSFEEADGKLLVFDDFSFPDDPYWKRYARARDRIDALPEHLRLYIKLVPHEIAQNADDLSNVECIAVSEQYEGIMVRDIFGAYKCGRSTLKVGTLGKIKRFRDTEATVIGFKELMHNDNVAEKDEFGRTKRSSHQEGKRGADTLGSLIMTSPEFTNSFDIGTGFTAAMRDEYWARRESLIGSIVTFKYQEVGVKDSPRFPVFRSFRKD